jgi:hypothetical protein
MQVLGIRCSLKDFSFAVMKGSQKDSSLIDSGAIKYPTGYNEADKMKWFYQEIGELLTKYKINGIGIKGVEPLAMKGKDYGDRMQLDPCQLSSISALSKFLELTSNNTYISKNLTREFENISAFSYPYS